MCKHFSFFTYQPEKRYRADALIFLALFLGIFGFALVYHEWGGGYPRGAEVVEVRGMSMSPFLPPGTKLLLMRDYYASHAVARNDIVAYDYRGNPGAPIVKVVYAVPEDTFALSKNGSGYNILVNSAVIKNHEGEPYHIPTANARMLLLYASSYPILPPDAYLILGESSAGSLDSTRFGFVSRRDIAGKLLVIHKAVN